MKNSFLTVLAVLFFYHFSYPQCDPVRDSLALVALFNSTGGPNWIDNTNWLVPGKEIGEWYGVDVNGEGCVECLDLDGKHDCASVGQNGNNLEGQLGISIGDFTELQELHLTKNKIDGQIPSQIGNLIKLKELFLYNNKLEGPIPNEIGNLTNLERLGIHSNNLSGVIPNEIGQLEKLINLNLFGNKIEGPLPNEIGKLNELSHLYLYNNSISGPIPQQIGDLKKLKYLDLSSNKISSNLPTEIGDLESIETIKLNANQITGHIPTSIGNLSLLQHVWLQNNQLTGPIPSEIFSAPVLTTLYLFSNNLTGQIPPEISNCTNLSNFRLNDNFLDGPIPKTIGVLDELHTINFSGNQISGEIPDEIGNLENLQVLQLNDNLIISAIPPSIGNLTNLYFLDLQNNSLSGSLPVEIANLNNASELLFSNNGLTGCFPIEYASICNINAYNFDNNKSLPWSGDFPRFCNGEDQIHAPCDDLDLSTEFDRITPDCECAGTPCDPVRDSLALVDLYNSTDGVNWTQKWDLAAPMSSWAGVELYPSGCLKALNLTNRNLNGTLPASINQLELAVDLTISQNQDLGGSLPLGLNRLKFLRVLDVSQNALEDGIPPDLGDIGELEELRINNNLFNGCLPAELSQLENLVIFDASNNNFDCTEFPSELVTLCSLEELNLGDNGELADDFSDFCSDGSYSSECYFNPDSLYCLEDIYFYAESTPCYSYLEDSTYLENTSIGLVDIKDVAYAYITKSYTTLEGESIDTMRLVGCAGLVCETCIVTADTIICKRDVLNEESYHALDFQETWNCSLGPVDCYIDRIDEFNFNSFGDPFGIEYLTEEDGDCIREVAAFSHDRESRVDYQFVEEIPLAGTLEWWVKVESGYHYDNFVLKDSLSKALLFTTDTWLGDVTWPGSTWLWVEADGTLTLEMATSKFDTTQREVITAENTGFRFGEWHALGVSFGPEGQYLMLDGELVASNPNHDQTLGAGGNFEEPLNGPTIGESASTYALNNQREGGFEGYVDRFRVSSFQREWKLAKDVNDCMVGTQEIKTIPLSIYPNPVHEFLNIVSKDGRLEGRINLLDLMGKVHFSEDVTGQHVKIDLGRIETGLYVLEYEEDSRVIYIRKLLVH